MDAVHYFCLKIIHFDCEAMQTDTHKLSFSGETYGDYAKFSTYLCLASRSCILCSRLIIVVCYDSPMVELMTKSLMTCF